MRLHRCLRRGDGADRSARGGHGRASRDIRWRRGDPNWVVDLHAAWTAELARSRIVIERKGALRVYETTLDAPPAVVWEYVTSPALRPKWQYGVEAVQQESGPVGRRGVGTVNHCIHGKDAIIEDVPRLATERLRDVPISAAGSRRPEARQHLRIRGPRRWQNADDGHLRSPAIGEGQGDRRRPGASARRHDRARARCAESVARRDLRVGSGCRCSRRAGASRHLTVETSANPWEVRAAPDPVLASRDEVASKLPRILSARPRAG